MLDDDYRALLNKMAAKHAVERFMLAFVVLCIVGIGVLLFFQNRALTTDIHNQQTATIARNKFIADNQKQIQDQTAQIKSYIQCIADFFAQPNRTNLTLSDLQDCQFSPTKFTGSASASASSTSGSSAQSTVPATPQTSNPTSQQVTTSSPPPEPNPRTPQQTIPGSVLQPVSNIVNSVIDGLVKLSLFN